MKKLLFFAMVLSIVMLGIVAAPVAASIPPGATGFEITCNVDGASVTVNGNYLGTIQNGQIDVLDPVYPASWEVTKDGYYPDSGTVDQLPGGSVQTVSAHLTLIPIGSGKGWFAVHSNAEGGSVAFDGSQKGTIVNGLFTYEVSTTATPLSTFTVSKPGYISYSGDISRMPAADETIGLYATLNPAPTQTTVPTPLPTASPIGGSTGWYLVHANADGGSVFFDNSFKGIIAGGVLRVQVYTTGTPYTSYRVETSGYATATGPLPAAPAAGATRDVFVMLQAEPQETTPGQIIGGDQGWYVVHSNVDGATVLFDTTAKGTISQGTLTVTVYTTGTPYQQYTVQKAGYVSYTGQIGRVPGNGESVDLYATLNPVPVTTAPAPTASPVPAGMPCLALIIGGTCIALRAKRS